MNQEYDCKACLSGIGRIEGHLAQQNRHIEQQNNSQTKIFYALIALAGASLGTKVIGTPWWIEIAMYTAIFSALFVLMITIAKWRCLSFWERWIRISFVLAVTYSFGLRVYHYQAATPFTAFEGMFKSGLDSLLALGFIVLAWRRDIRRRKDKRRHDD